MKRVSPSSDGVIQLHGDKDGIERYRKQMNAYQLRKKHREEAVAHVAFGKAEAEVVRLVDSPRRR